MSEAAVMEYRDVDVKTIEKTKGEAGVDKQAMRQVEIRLESTKVKNLQSVCDQIIAIAKEFSNVKGPAFLKKKNLTIATRKTPCGEGSKTWDHYRMTIYGRLIRFVALESDLKKLAEVSGYDVSVTVTRKHIE